MSVCAELRGAAVEPSGVQLSVGGWGMLLATLAAGTVPFCALGCVLGYTAGPTSAPAIANLIYLPMSFLSGLWVPLPMLPDVVRTLAPFLPPYHLAELARDVITGQPADASHAFALAAFTTLFLAGAVFAYRRDSDRTWG